MESTQNSANLANTSSAIKMDCHDSMISAESRKTRQSRSLFSNDDSAQDSRESKNPHESPTILNLKNIYFKYERDFVLKNINFSVKDGDFIALIGPNGGGKTTLAKILLGLLKPTSGEVIYPNVTLFNKNSLIGYTSQDSSINTDFPITAFDVVLMGFLQRKIFGYKITKTDKIQAQKIMEKLGIENIRNRKIGSLSGGQRQRVMIARALCGNPKLLIFDEPTANIDLPTQKEIYQILKQINANHTIILISHDISVLEYAKCVLFVNCEILRRDIKSSNNFIKGLRDGKNF